jgi:hypothetical protein
MYISAALKSAVSSENYKKIKIRSKIEPAGFSSCPTETGAVLAATWFLGSQ